MNINLMHKSRQITLVIKKKVIKNLGSICLGGKEGGKRAEKRKDVSLPLVGKKGNGKTSGGQEFSLGPTNYSL